MTESVREKKTPSSSMMPDWSVLPEDLLYVVSTHLENWFDVIHARSVCNSWRSSFPFPSFLLHQSYSIPKAAKFPEVSEELCTLVKIPLFLFRAKTPFLAADVLASQYFWEGMAADVSTCDYFLGGIGQDEFENQIEFPSPVQCSVKVNIPSTYPKLMYRHDCQIIPLGHEYRIIGWDVESWKPVYRGAAFLPLNKEKGVGEEFVVILNFTKVLLVLRSAEMRWKHVEKTSEASCRDLVAFRGRFYATCMNGDIYVFDPYTLIETPLMPSQPLTYRGSRILVRSGDDDELFLVERFNPHPEAGNIDYSRFACKVSILDEKAGKWVEVSYLGDRVLFIGHYGNVSCSAKELPSGCGVSGNSIMFTDMSFVTYAYKYGVDTGNAEDDLTLWRSSNENRVNILMTSPLVRDEENHLKHLSTSPVLVLRVEL